MIEVPYPPPPARVEDIPEERSSGQVWIDGQWDWDGTAWKWREGLWTTPPSGAYFTPWSTTRRADGQLLFAGGAWRDKDGHPLHPATERQACAPLLPRSEASGQ